MAGDGSKGKKPGKGGSSAAKASERDTAAKPRRNTYRIGGHRVAFPEGKKPFGAQFA